MTRLLGILTFSVFLLATCPDVHAGRSQFLTFATRDQVFMAIGKYDPRRGWVPYQEFYDPPQLQDVFTIYTMAGEIAHVKNIDTARAEPRGTPVEWGVDISPWYKQGSGEPFALAVLGQSPLVADPARVLPLEDPELLARVSVYLKKRGLNVAQPRLTQAFEVTLSSGGPNAVLLAVHSDASALRNEEPAAVYAVALLQVETSKGWLSFPLAQQTSNKPRSRSIDEHQRYHGTLDFYRFLSCLDIDGDGRKEIVLYIAQENFGTQIDVFSFDGRRAKTVLSAFKHLYN